MRSILALGLAALILAANAPGFFTETPVCSAVDGVRVAPGPAPVDATPPCCGKPDCPMHPHGCGKVTACTMGAAAAHDRSASHGTKLCAPSCGREGARVAPGTPDPWTVDMGARPRPCFAEIGRAHVAPHGAPTHRSDPAVPPPRS